MTALPDRQDRIAATTVFDRNIVVLAGAGTGKTSLLVERVLNLVGSGFCELEHLAAITFTEKAAAELRLQIAAGLEQLRAAAAGERDADPGEPSGRSFAWLTGDRKFEGKLLAERALAALQQMDRARLLTIHAFCAELLRAFPVEARVDPDFRVDTGEQATLLCRAHWDRFVETELGPDGKRHGLWNRTLGAFGLGELAEAARVLSGWNFPLELLAPERARGGAALLAEQAAQVVVKIDRLEKRAGGITPGQTSWFATVRRCLTALATGDEAEFARLLDDPAVRRQLAHDRWLPGKKLTGVSKAEFLRVADHARQLSRLLSRLDDGRFGDLVETLAPFVVSFREEFSRRGFVSFDGLLALTRDLLRDHPKVRERLKRRFDTLLVDEFQDTDPLQYEIVLMLGESPDGSCDDPWQVALKPGRLFVVGDPKQSIYRFRGADYQAFRRAISRIADEGAIELSLTANFRSVAGILDPVNALFDEGSTTSWRPDDTQPVYRPITAAGGGGLTPTAVEIWTVAGNPSDPIDRRRRAEGQVIAEEVLRLRADGVRYKDISILFRTFASIPTYLRPLRERDIPFVVDGGKDFIKRTEIKQSLAILRTLAQPSDATALLAFLRSPAGGVPDTELANWAAAGRRWDWRNESGDASAESCPRITTCFTLLRKLHDDTRDLPPDAAVRTIVERVLLLPLAAAAFEGAQRVANLHKLVAAASTLTRDGHLSLEDLVDEIGEGGLAELEAESPLSDDDTDAVRITSIHKMKGLENDWVLLPDLARQRPNVHGVGLRFAVLRTADGTTRLAAQQGKTAVNAAWIRHHLEHLKHEESEETRVLYVALTRARNRLVLISSPGKKDKPTHWYDALAAWGYDPAAPPADDDTLSAGTVRHRIVKPPAVASVEDRAQPTRYLDAVAAYDGAREALLREATPPFHTPSSVGREGESERSVERGEGREIGLATGRVLHHALEFWDGADPKTLSQTAAELARTEADRLGIEREALRSEVAELLAGFHGSELGARFGKLDIVARELALLLRDDDGTCWRGSIDLVYREDNAYVIADYKTDRTSDEDTLRERYAGQLSVYARVVRAALDLAELPRTEIWLLRHGRRVVVPTIEATTAAPEKRNEPGQQSLF